MAEQKLHWNERVPFWVHLFLIYLLPIILLLSHRNIVTVMAFMTLSVLVMPKIWQDFAAVKWKTIVLQPSPMAVVLWIGFFCAYALLSVLWTPSKGEWSWGLQYLLFLSCSGVIVWFAMNASDFVRSRLAKAMRLALIISAVLLAIEGLTGGLFRAITPPVGRPDKDMVAVARGTSIAIYLFFPVCWMIMMDRLKKPDQAAWVATTKTLVILTLVATAAVMLNITANIIALALGLIALFVATLYPKLSARVIIAGFIGVFLLAPFAALSLPPIEQLLEIESLPASWTQRLVTWRIAVEQIFSSPAQFLFGGGVGLGDYLEHSAGMVTIYGADVPLLAFAGHAHNIPLQIWLEFGLIGVSLWTTMIFLAGRLWLNMQLDRSLMAAIAGVLAVIFVYAMIEAGLWTLWRLVGPILTVYCFCLLPRKV